MLFRPSLQVCQTSHVDTLLALVNLPAELHGHLNVSERTYMRAGLGSIDKVLSHFPRCGSIQRTTPTV